MKITQSFLKDFAAYLDGDECGNLIHYKWIEGKFLEPTPDQKVGSYFEYMVSGALPKDKQIPKAEYQKNGKDMYAPYLRAYENADKVKELLKKKKIRIIDFGKTYTKGRFQGTIDLICEAEEEIVFNDGFVLKKGDKCVIDLKYSGLLEDRWNVFGWQWTDEQKMYHGFQAKQYSYITNGLPFFFWVNSSKNTDDIELFRIVVSEEAIQNHISYANHLKEKFDIMKEIGGFEPRPKYSRCMKCALKETCKDKHEFPEPVTIYL